MDDREGIVGLASRVAVTASRGVVASLQGGDVREAAAIAWLGTRIVGLRLRCELEVATGAIRIAWVRGRIWIAQLCDDVITEVRVRWHLWRR
jgi:hypothetical protein